MGPTTTCIPKFTNRACVGHAGACRSVPAGVALLAHGNVNIALARLVPLPAVGLHSCAVLSIIEISIKMYKVYSHKACVATLLELILYTISHSHPRIFRRASTPLGLPSSDCLLLAGADVFPAPRGGSLELPVDHPPCGRLLLVAHIPSSCRSSRPKSDLQVTEPQSPPRPPPRHKLSFGRPWLDPLVLASPGSASAPRRSTHARSPSSDHRAFHFLRENPLWREGKRLVCAWLKVHAFATQGAPGAEGALPSRALAPPRQVEFLCTARTFRPRILNSRSRNRS